MRHNQTDRQRETDKSLLAAILAGQAPPDSRGDKLRHELAEARGVYSSRAETAKIIQEIAGKVVAVKNFEDRRPKALAELEWAVAHEASEIVRSGLSATKRELEMGDAVCLENWLVRTLVAATSHEASAADRAEERGI